MDVFNSAYCVDQSGCPHTGYLPTLNSFTATNTTSTWSQTPPSNVPWGISYSQPLPQVIRFTGHPDTRFPHQSSITSSCAKRRLPEDEEGLQSDHPANKQFISEERMTARMSEMHISQTQSPSPATLEDICIEEIEEDSMSDMTPPISQNNNSDSMPSLYISEELRKLKATIDPIIPTAMLPKSLNSKALVLWSPRGWGTNPEPQTESPEPEPLVEEEEAEYIRSDDPACSVVITEIPSEDDMAMDL